VLTPILTAAIDILLVWRDVPSAEWTSRSAAARGKSMRCQSSACDTEMGIVT